MKILSSVGLLVVAIAGLPGPAQGQGWYLGSELGAHVVPVLRMTGLSNDRASVCDEFINPQYATVTRAAGYEAYNCTGPDRRDVKGRPKLDQSGGGKLEVVLQRWPVAAGVNSTGRRNTSMMRCCDGETETETVRPSRSACDAFARSPASRGASGATTVLEGDRPGAVE